VGRRAGWAALVGFLGWSIGAASPRPAVLRVRGLVLVDDAGTEVARLVPTATGAELVLGGESQASLVTDGPVAALNLVAERPLVRPLPSPGPGEDDPELPPPPAPPRG
jgi:hypothetical protein